MTNKRFKNRSPNGLKIFDKATRNIIIFLKIYIIIYQSIFFCKFFDKNEVAQ